MSDALIADAEFYAKSFDAKGTPHAKGTASLLRQLAAALRAQEAAPPEPRAVCPRCQHGVKHKTGEEHDAEMCDDIYSQRSGEVLGLVEALDAIATLCGGHDEQSRAVQKIVEDAIGEHAKWTR